MSLSHPPRVQIPSVPRWQSPSMERAPESADHNRRSISNRYPGLSVELPANPRSPCALEDIDHQYSSGGVLCIPPKPRPRLARASVEPGRQHGTRVPLDRVSSPPTSLTGLDLSDRPPNVMDRPNACRTMISHLAWAELKHYTNNITLHDMSSNIGTLLEDLDKEYIAVAIVRERGFVELLEQEKQERDVRRGSAPAEGTFQGDPDVGIKRTSSGIDFAERIWARGSRDSGYFPDMPSVGVEPLPARVYEMVGEPATPRSEAAAGQMFQNAAFKRTRRSPPVCCTSTPGFKSLAVNRLQFEAAWKWIDEHIEEYVEAFASAEPVGHKSKRALWDELIGLRRRKEDLEKAIKGFSEP